MGTFHDNLGELHGITVLVETDGPTVYVGRCHEQADGHIELRDADEHDDGADGLSKDDYIRRAAKWGVFPKHKVLRVPAARVTSVTRLGDIAG